MKMKFTNNLYVKKLVIQRCTNPCITSRQKLPLPESKSKKAVKSKMAVKLMEENKSEIAAKTELNAKNKIPTKFKRVLNAHFKMLT